MLNLTKIQIKEPRNLTKILILLENFDLCNALCIHLCIVIYMYAYPNSTEIASASLKLHKQKILTYLINRSLCCDMFKITISHHFLIFDLLEKKRIYLNSKINLLSPDVSNSRH